MQDTDMQDDDQGIKPLVIDTSTAAASHTDATDQTGSEAESVADSTGVDQDVAPSTELSSPVLRVVLAAGDGSELCDEEDDDRGEYDELSERHHGESVYSDGQSTVDSPSKDLTGSVSAGDLSPGPGTTARCSKSRRKADRVRTASHCRNLSQNTL